jgi:hypothetical protein
MMLGLRTTTNKAKMVDDCYAQLRDGLIYYSPLLHDELMSFVETKNPVSGRVHYAAGSGAMDNRTMALILALQGYRYYHRLQPVVEKQRPAPNTFQALLDRREKMRKMPRKQRQALRETSVWQ